MHSGRGGPKDGWMMHFIFTFMHIIVSPFHDDNNHRIRRLYDYVYDDASTPATDVFGNVE